MASLKVTLATSLRGMPVLPLGGVQEITVGGFGWMPGGMVVPPPPKLLQAANDNSAKAVPSCHRDLLQSIFMVGPMGYCLENPCDE
jgi:hypothetical protein